MSVQACANCSALLATTAANGARYCMATKCQSAKRAANRQAKRVAQRAADREYLAAFDARRASRIEAKRREARRQETARLAAVELGAALLGKLSTPAARCLNCRAGITRGRYCADRTECRTAARKHQRHEAQRRRWASWH